MALSSIDDFLYDAKVKLRAMAPVAELNSRIKAKALRSGLKKLSAHYTKEAQRLGLTYDEQAAFGACRNHIRKMDPGFPKHTPRIFWVGANRDQDESGFLQALRKCATVIEFKNWQGGYGQWYWDEKGRVQVYDPEIVVKNDQALVTQLDAALAEGPVDLLMGQMWANYLSTDALSRVRLQGIPVINVSMDDRLPDNWGARRGVRLGAVGLASVTDLVLTTSSETCSWYQCEGCPAVFWPLASDPGVFQPQPGAHRDINVLFIGNKYGIREKLVRELDRRGVHVECYGGGWPNGPTTAEQSAALFKRARIVLGVGTVGYCDDVFTLKLRDFDAPMSGALYLTHRSPDLARLYREGTEIECYACPDEAARKIKHYLSHPPELSQIATAGHALAVRRDTWLNRLRTTFAEIGVMEAADSLPGADTYLNSHH